MGYQWTGDISVAAQEADPGSIPGVAANPRPTSLVTSIKMRELRWNADTQQLGIQDLGTNDIEFFFWTDETATTPKTVQAGHTFYGVPFFIASGGPTFVTATPAGAADDGSPINGMMINPRHGWQGLDGRAQLYAAWLNAENQGGAWMRPEDVVLKCKSRMPRSTNAHWWRMSAVGYLICLRHAPDEQEMIQLLLGTTQLEPRKRYMLQLPADEAFVGYPCTYASKPTVASAVRRLAAFNPGVGLMRASESKRMLSVSGTGTTDNFGRVLLQRMTEPALMLADDEFSVTEKKAILTAMAVRFSEQWPVFALSPGVWSEADGAQNSGWEPYIAFGMWATGNADLIPTIGTAMGGNAYTQPVEITEERLPRFLSPHSNTAPDWPTITRRSTITAVDGNIISVPIPLGRNLNSWVGNATELVRESDGAKALILSSSRTSNTVTIDAQPDPPFQVNDVVHGFAFPQYQLGDVNWNIRGQVQLYTMTRSGSTTYRHLNNFEGVAAALKAYGLLHPAQVMFEYARLCRLPNYPSAANDWSNSTEGQYDAAFFTQNSAALNDVPSIWE